MLGIVLTVLKVIGIILLCILGLVLLILLLLLCVPIRYNGSVRHHDTTDAAVRISYLLHIVHGGVYFAGGRLRLIVRVFGIPVKRKLLMGEPEPGDQIEDKAEDKPEEKTEDNSEAKSEEKTGDNSEDKAEEKTEDKAEEKTEDKSEDSTGDTSDQEANSEEKDVVSRLEALYNKYINDHTIGMLRLVKKQLVKILKHILPRRLKGDLRFGMEDPANTGYILAVLSLIYKRVNGLRITPEFEEEVFECDLKLRGHIRLGTVIVLVLRLILNKDFRYIKKNILAKDK